MRDIRLPMVADSRRWHWLAWWRWSWLRCWYWLACDVEVDSRRLDDSLMWCWLDAEDCLTYCAVVNWYWLTCWRWSRCRCWDWWLAALMRLRCRDWLTYWRWCRCRCRDWLTCDVEADLGAKAGLTYWHVEADSDADTDWLADVCDSRRWSWLCWRWSRLNTDADWKHLLTREAGSDADTDWACGVDVDSDVRLIDLLTSMSIRTLILIDLPRRRCRFQTLRLIDLLMLKCRRWGWLTCWRWGGSDCFEVLIWLADVDVVQTREMVTPQYWSWLQTLYIERTFTDVEVDSDATEADSRCGRRTCWFWLTCWLRWWSELPQWSGSFFWELFRLG